MAKVTYSDLDIIGKRFGKLTVIKRSNKRAPRGKRSVPLWECVCDCGNITYKSTDVLTNPNLSMCSDCAKKYATEKMRQKAGFFNGTQISKIQTQITESDNFSGVRGVYFDKKSSKWRARIKVKGKTINIGSYANINDAIKARKLAEEKYFENILDEYYANKDNSLSANKFVISAK
ncbi:MAG: AP2 domain-containing protein [Clostridia bacterium]|nr:AP2 domain-containing protein [Clostridia bacterium]